MNGWHRPALRGVLHGIVALASLGVLFLLASRDGRLWFVGTPEILGVSNNILKLGGFGCCLPSPIAP